MLVLSRQRDETIMIGDEIEITVVDIRGDKVRLGITAPTRIAVHRKEVYEAIKSENHRASQINRGDMDVLRRAIAPGPAKTVGGAMRNRISAPARIRAPDEKSSPLPPPRAADQERTA